DAKLPRDSIPDSLAVFWTMFFVRTLPWSLLLPAAAVHAWRWPERRSALVLPIALIGVVVGFFSLAAGRLEHYSLPAAPAVALVVFGFAEIAHERLEPLFSWRPLARTIRSSRPRDTAVFFRASDEYQLCGGLDYYTGAPVALLSPPGWTPPTFLAGRTDRLFTPRSELERLS